ncbi:MAG TPA: hypothetical protein VGJ28_07500, partial [Micromonosporaceae bacterium]
MTPPDRDAGSDYTGRPTPRGRWRGRDRDGAPTSEDGWVTDEPVEDAEPQDSADPRRGAFRVGASRFADGLRGGRGGTAPAEGDAGNPRRRFGRGTPADSEEAGFNGFEEAPSTGRHDTVALDNTGDPLGTADPAGLSRKFSGFGRRTPSPRPHDDAPAPGLEPGSGRFPRPARRRGYTGVQPGATAPDPVPTSTPPAQDASPMPESVVDPLTDRPGDVARGGRWSDGLRRTLGRSDSAEPAAGAAGPISGLSPTSGAGLGDAPRPAEDPIRSMRDRLRGFRGAGDDGRRPGALGAYGLPAPE